ncbi:MAG TPA: cobyrinic acid a,c-diamide synthase [Azoarcus taiwanensis]|uniref:Cobyrinic acid a,c-diamide synthase n=1 Tax=Azoarcus taiwanensis TaxID=666964 RepID=A0A972F8N5_9RHOO|nr:cobyrinic acid a,c-diamide synthase [Azoarcus taiwanensis]NMG04032.1 cobyrinic acid a,c-diamide synthase [Azoarcus taiwanensis]HRQ56613.1 cobyrinic acid a,c-diamide synthase [Azoarcus taiwanensis]
MLGFLQGFAYGLLISCMPWFMLGMFNPSLALGTDKPARWQVFLRYAVVLPFVGLLIWATSLWGGFEPWLSGWLAGLGAIPVGLFVERRWRAWKRRRAEHLEATTGVKLAEADRARKITEARETGLRELDPARPPTDADELVLALCAAKGSLLEARRPELAALADRIDGRYTRLKQIIAARFDARELAFERAEALVGDVSRGALATLQDIAVLAQSVAGIDEAFVRRRLAQQGADLGAGERATLMHRLQMLADAERRIREHTGRIEAALTAMDHAALSISAVETNRPRSPLLADEALAELRRFADNAHRYQHSR